MDSELRSLVTAVRDGRIRDPERIRDIVAEAKHKVERAERMWRDDSLLLWQTEQAFVSGWESQRDNAC